MKYKTKCLKTLLFASLPFITGSCEVIKEIQKRNLESKVQAERTETERKKGEEFVLLFSGKEQYNIDPLTAEKGPKCFAGRNIPFYFNDGKLAIYPRDNLRHGDIYGKEKVSIGSIMCNNKGKEIVTEINITEINTKRKALSSYIIDEYVIKFENDLYLLHFNIRGDCGIYEVRFDFKEKFSNKLIHSTGFNVCLNKK